MLDKFIDDPEIYDLLAYFRLNFPLLGRVYYASGAISPNDEMGNPHLNDEVMINIHDLLAIIDTPRGGTPPEGSSLFFEKWLSQNKTFSAKRLALSLAYLTGHELTHALGLSHPGDSLYFYLNETYGLDFYSLMSNSYALEPNMLYPTAYLARGGMTATILNKINKNKRPHFNSAQQAYLERVLGVK